MMIGFVRSDLWEVLLLQKYNTRLVVLCTILLGISAGLAGSFLLLRKRSLMSDTLSHACLPGIGLMFILVTLAGGNGKSLSLLLLGATITGLLGVVLVTAIRNTSRIKDDAAMGIVLSVFFGLGIVMLSLAQTLGGASAGLESFIYGKTASMVNQDLHYLLWITGGTLVLCIALQKEFSLICFDENFARSLAWPVHFLDMVMMGLVVAAVG
jgi:manganese/zinc/iron transport system permease protein